MYFLEGSKIGLRPLNKSDVAGNYGNWLNDTIVCDYNSHHRYPCSAGDLEEYVNQVAHTASNLVLAIEEKTSKTHIGNISLQKIDYLSRCAELAFLIGERNYWHQGVGTEAGILLITHGFNELNLHRIYLGTSEWNQGMQHLAETLGFTQEGVRRQAMFKHGRFCDILEYGLLREEWIKESELGFL